MYIHGGKSAEGTSQGDTYALLLQRGEWVRLFLRDHPSARAYHAFTVMGKNCFVYGGASTPENFLLEDVWAFNFEELDFTGLTSGW